MGTLAASWSPPTFRPNASRYSRYWYGLRVSGGTNRLRQGHGLAAGGAAGAKGGTARCRMAVIVATDTGILDSGAIRPTLRPPGAPGRTELTGNSATSGVHEPSAVPCTMHSMNRLCRYSGSAKAMFSPPSLHPGLADFAVIRQHRGLYVDKTACFNATCC